MKPPFPSFTKSWRNDTYPALSPAGRATGKTVVITGASGGIGRATAVSFAKAGAARIALLGRRQNALKETARSVEAVNSQTPTSVHVCDSTDADALRIAATAIGSWDVLVLNAGSSTPRSPIQTADVDVWWAGFEINVKGSFLTAQAFLPSVNLQHSPSIISVNAALPFTPTYPAWSGKSAYTGSKIALAQIVQHIAQEHPSINAVSVHPGIVPTDMLPVTEEQKVEMKEVGLLDTHDLPGDFFVWLSTPEAGRAC